MKSLYPQVTIIAAVILFVPCEGTLAQGSGPDVIVGDLNGISNYGSSGGISAFAIGTTSCNQGNQPLPWIANTNQHPVIGQNLYKLVDGRFSMVGRSWLKHGFTALQQSLCSSCSPYFNGTALGVGCSDPYSSGLNGSQSGLGPRFEVNAATGNFPYPFTSNPAPSGNIARRLQVYNNDLSSQLNPNAQYFAEGQYVHPTDAQSGLDNNNASYRECSVSGGSSYTLGFVAPTVRLLPAIYAWPANDPGVAISTVDVPQDGRFIVAVKSTWISGYNNHYEIAVHNLNSDRSAGSVTVSLGCGANVANLGFSMPSYHSGEPYGNIPWTGTVASNGIIWQAQHSYSQNPNADALRWGSLHNFWFDSDMPPTALVIGLFKPGTLSSVSVPLGPFPSTLPEYQTNSFNATLDIDGLWGTSSAPATHTVPVNSVHAINFMSFNSGSAWDLAYGTAPLIPRSACALTASDGQVVNLNLTDPTLGTWYQVMTGSPPFQNFSFNFAFPIATTLSLQMIIVAPNQASNIGLSQPVRLIVQ